jgi:thiosulfate reductase cytochrome b subunit
MNLNPDHYSQFEQVRHWTQAALTITLLITGFDIHGSYDLLPFKEAAVAHISAAGGLFLLWWVALLWHWTTGEWRDYVPRRAPLRQQMEAVLFGLLFGAPHPLLRANRPPSPRLARFANAVLRFAISPLLWLSGLFFLAYSTVLQPLFPALALREVALLHTGAAFAMAIYLIVHVYLAVIGREVGHDRPAVRDAVILTERQAPRRRRQRAKTTA